MPSAGEMVAGKEDVGVSRVRVSKCTSFLTQHLDDARRSGQPFQNTLLSRNCEGMDGHDQADGSVTGKQMKRQKPTANVCGRTTPHADSRQAYNHCLSARRHGIVPSAS